MTSADVPMIWTCQWKHVASHDDTFIVFQAEMKGKLLDVTGVYSGVLASPQNRITAMDHDVHTTGELFAGGFSGWTHAVRRLRHMGFKMDHRFAVEYDNDCIQAFARSHGFRTIIGPHAFSIEDDDLPDRMLIHADIRQGQWMHLIGNQSEQSVWGFC